MTTPQDPGSPQGDPFAKPGSDPFAKPTAAPQDQPPAGGYGAPSGGYPPPPSAPPAYGAPGYGPPAGAPGYGPPTGPPGYGQPAYGQPGSGPGYGPGAKTNVLAIVSLVTTFLCSPVGLITGIIALSQIKKTREAGRGLALAGVIISSLGIALIIGIFALGGILTSNLECTTTTSPDGSGFSTNC